MPLDRSPPPTLSRLMRTTSFLPTWSILLLCLAASAIAGWQIDQASRDQTRVRFESSVARLSDALQVIFERYEALLRAGAGLFNAHGKVTEADWEQFLMPIGLAQNYPGIQGFGYAALVEHAELPDYVSRRKAASGDFKIVPSGTRDRYAVIEFVLPHNARNDRAVGFDMYSESVRREAMNTAAATGSPRITRRVTLVQEGQTDIQPGTLIYMPVYDRSAGTPRSTKVIGYTYMALRMQSLFDTALRAQLPQISTDLSVVVYDGALDDARAPLFASGRAQRASAADAGSDWLRSRTQIEIAGRPWTIEAAALPGYRLASEQREGLAAFALGALLSLLITSVAAILTLARERDADARNRLEREIQVRLESQRALERANKEVLISNQELIHRVKNMMSVVTSIANQTARYSPEPKVFNAVFRDRLAALGRVQDFMKPDPDFMPDFKDFLPKIIAPYRSPSASGASLDGPSVRLPQSSATMISLVINELAANAVRYGAWSVPGGRVHISWNVAAADDDAEALTIDWVERDGPTVRPPEHSGFGSNVLKFAIEQALRGKYATTFNATGLECRIEIPLRRREPAAGQRIY